MFNLVCDVIFATFAVTKTTSVLLEIGLEVTRRLYIRIILVFLTAEALVNEVDEHAMAEVAELDHAPEISLDAVLCLLKASRKLNKDLFRADNLLSRACRDRL